MLVMRYSEPVQAIGTRSTPAPLGQLHSGETFSGTRSYKPVNHTSWVAVVTPTDRPKSVRNRCLIELFCGVVCVVTFPF